VVLEEKWPVLGRHERAAEWLQVWRDLGRAHRTIDAYARGMAEYLELCERENVDPLAANRAHIAVYVRELTSRPSRRGANVVSIDSESGLANDLTATRTFFRDCQEWEWIPRRFDPVRALATPEASRR
jgi:integrase/recombinase XerD